MLHHKTTRIDLNSSVHFSAIPTRGAADERWTNDLFATHGLSATRHVSSMRATLQRPSQNQNILLSRSISRHGLRPTDRPRISARYRSLFANVWPKTLSRLLFAANKFPATRWPTPIKCGPGIFTRTSLKRSSPPPPNSMPRPTWDSNWTTRSTPWIQPLSICVCRCSHGQRFVEPSRISRCTRC